MLVPEAGVVPLPMASETMLTPGAMMSRVLLLLVKEATTSLSFVAPTDTTLLRQAGEVITVPELLFPEEAKAMTPLARKVFMAAAPAIL
jgi:hypothetical protein